MTATPASHPFEIREHDAGGMHLIAMRGAYELPTVYEDPGAALAPRVP